MATASGISEVDFNEKIHYPNPASDLLTIAIDGMKSIYILNLKGEIFKKIQTGQQQFLSPNYQQGII